MSKYTFVCEHWDGGKVTVEKEIETLNDVLETFEFFLKGSGFYFKGQIDVVPLEDQNDNEFHFDDEDDSEYEAFDFSNMGAAQPIITPDISTCDITLDLSTEPALDLFSEYQEDRSFEGDANAILHARV